MPKLEEQKILNRAKQLYQGLKREKYPFRAPEALPRFESDHCKALLTALVEALNDE